MNRPKPRRARKVYRVIVDGETTFYQDRSKTYTSPYEALKACQRLQAQGPKNDAAGRLWDVYVADLSAERPGGYEELLADNGIE